MKVAFSALVANFALSGFSRAQNILFADVPIEGMHYFLILVIFFVPLRSLRRLRNSNEEDLQFSL